jgi:hypothetical protein
VSLNSSLYVGTARGPDLGIVTRDGCQLQRPLGGGDALARAASRKAHATTDRAGWV